MAIRRDLGLWSMGRARRGGAQRRQQCAVWSIATTVDVSDRKKPPLGALIRRPISLLALVPTPVVLFVAGAVAGAVGKTVVAPLDRVKILLQVQGGLERGAVREAAVKGGALRSLWAICQSEGILGFWKGNVPQVDSLINESDNDFNHVINASCFEWCPTVQCSWDPMNC